MALLVDTTVCIRRQDTQLSLASGWLSLLAGAGPEPDWAQLKDNRQDKAFELLHFDTHLPHW